MQSNWANQQEALPAELIINAIEQNGQANIILATGASQFETLKQLISEKDIDWSKVVMFHLDEYIGLPESSNASFRKYLKERFLDKVPALKATYLVNGETDPVRECNRLNSIIELHPIDVALVGIGENGHLAFNDPPADFDTKEPYIIVELEEQCRTQQFNEGWFKSVVRCTNKGNKYVHQPNLQIKIYYLFCTGFTKS
ncbi:MAG: 6-phosphogluconolactonase [Chitinophagaceae bacterium]